MKKTLHIDEELLAQARKELKASTDTETVRLALAGVLRSAAYERARSFMGSEPDAEDVPRRREAPTRSAKRARRSV